MKSFKLVTFGIVATALTLLPVSPLLAQEKKEGAPTAQAAVPQSVVGGAALGAGLGMGITILGAGLGLGKIGSAALEGMARQPEVAPRIQTAMIIVAAMLEGATLASVIFCLLVGNKATF
jgi:F-type H+-transporting ATPase subunit c